ncbi:uncharacterized protein LOC121369685 [Gigantopelta aegis]|uniref:uncharacterized protein LOC121369685 n=1 Tax=Gigantopelta aegis TaxID=1735272 RepID=UPI001B88E1FC|nr:uncharacterized protein LOC121369685 [Gigantopelta aegis]
MHPVIITFSEHNTTNENEFKWTRWPVYYTEILHKCPGTKCNEVDMPCRCYAANLTIREHDDRLLWLLSKAYDTLQLLVYDSLVVVIGVDFACLLLNYCHTKSVKSSTLKTVNTEMLTDKNKILINQNKTLSFIFTNTFVLIMFAKTLMSPNFKHYQQKLSLLLPMFAPKRISLYISKGLESVFQPAERNSSSAQICSSDKSLQNNLRTGSRSPEPEKKPNESYVLKTVVTRTRKSQRSTRDDITRVLDNPASCMMTNLNSRHSGSSDARSHDARSSDANSSVVGSSVVGSSDTNSSDVRSSDANSSDIRSSDANSSGARSSDDNSSDVRSSDANSSDARSSDVRSSDANSSDISSSNANSSDISSSDANSSDASSSDANSSDVRSSAARSSDARSSDANSSDVRSSDANSSDVRSSAARSSDARSSDANSSDVRSSDARSSDVGSSDARYNDEMVRYASFREFPSTSAWPNHLAAAGFYHSGLDDQVTCYSCRMTHRNWRRTDDPMEIHRRESPGCRFVLNQEENHPVEVQEEARDRLIRISGVSPNLLSNLLSRHTDSTGPAVQAASLTGTGSAILVVSTTSIESAMLVTSLGAAYSSESLLLDRPITDNDLFGSPSTAGGNLTVDHGTTQTVAASAGLTTADTTIISSTNVQLPPDSSRNSDRPPRTWQQSKYPKYAALDTRILTFAGRWPHPNNQTPRQLGEAGFFFSGNSRDSTTCYFCGGGLRNWIRGDNPFVEHARWFSQCEFIREVKGDKFVDLVQELNENEEEVRVGRQGSPDLHNQTAYAYGPKECPSSRHPILDPNHVQPQFSPILVVV